MYLYFTVITHDLTILVSGSVAGYTYMQERIINILIFYLTVR